jgi:hypothetical protein
LPHYMKIFINLLALLFIPVFLFAGYTFAKSNSNIYNTEPITRAYLLDEILPSGEIINHKGVSDQIEPNKIAIDLNVNPYPEDKFNDFPSVELELGSKITMHRAPEYKVIDGKKSLVLRSWAKSVGELLDEKKIVLGEEDKINYTKSENLFLGMDIKIIRVARTKVFEYEDIEYRVVEKKDPELEKGKTKVERAGVLGEKKFTYEVVREDGEEVSKTLVGMEITKEPVDKILIVGTKIISYGSGVASWYISSSEMIAACNIIPKGTNVRVVNLSNGKEVTVRIVGGGLRSDRIIDLSTGAFQALGASLGQGVIGNVRLEKVY